MKVIVFGSNGLVGSSISRVLETSNKVDELVKSNRLELDLFKNDDVQQFVKDQKPNVIINAAAKVGGIHANNTKRTEFILENLKINMNILESCLQMPDIKIINLGSSCIYPLNAKNPISESEFMNGKLEPTNSPYAMAKLSAIEIGRSMSKQFGHQILNLMPTNLYGPNDYFSDLDSHVIPALIHRMQKTIEKGKKEFKVWGSGSPLREFLYVDDLSNFINFIIDKEIKDDLINVGSGQEISIKDLAMLIKELMNFKGDIIFDSSKPDGNPRKLLDSSLLSKLGWNEFTDLKSGLESTIHWYKSNPKSNRIKIN
jgi:GDP-L-fucose synthase|tara:strand:- start:3439 stop:4380 length:942 start_codon:yes stop_codon:yes gene_type:complete